MGMNMVSKAGCATEEIVMVGNFPPPVHGMAVANAQMRALFVQVGVKVRVYDTSPPTIGGWFARHIVRFLKHLAVWAYLVWRTRGGRDTVYLALSGGIGLVYDAVTVALCRLRKLRCVLHHHGWGYLNDKATLMALVVRLAGPESLHVVLCARMGDQLSKLYGVNRLLVLTNAFLLGIGTGSNNLRPRSVPNKVGFLSNLTDEKGVSTFLNLARISHERSLGYEFILAGPCSDVSLRRKIEAAVDSGYVEWRGAVYGQDKDEFWKDIHVFIFPTRYRYEAEPIVVWEALSAGVPVLATPRGCIANQVDKAGVIIPIDNEEEFVHSTLRKLIEWRQHPSLYEEASGKASAQFRAAVAAGEFAWQRLLAYICGKRLDATKGGVKT